MDALKEIRERCEKATNITASESFVKGGSEFCFRKDDANFVMRLACTDVPRLCDAVEEQEKLIDELIALVRVWHGMGHPKAEEAFLWKVYSEQSPEMKRITEARSRLTEILKGHP